MIKNTINGLYYATKRDDLIKDEQKAINYKIIVFKKVNKLLKLWII